MSEEMITRMVAERAALIETLCAAIEADEYYRAAFPPDEDA